VADFLVALAAIAIFRPLNSALSSLMIATDRTFTLMSLELVKVSTLFLGLWYLSRFGEDFAAASLGIALAVQFAVTLTVLSRHGFPAMKLLAELRGPAIAASLIIIAVWAMRTAFEHWAGVPLALQLIVEIAVGAAAYLLGLLLFARRTLRQFVSVVRQQLVRRREAPAAPSPG
jgi:hypothetical protein